MILERLDHIAEAKMADAKIAEVTAAHKISHSMATILLHPLKLRDVMAKIAPVGRNYETDISKKQLP